MGQPNQAKFEISLYKDESMVAKLTQIAGASIESMLATSRLDENELAFLFIVTEGLRCLSSGKSIDLHFNPYENSEDEVTIVKCQWGKTGCLRLLEQGVGEKFMHANTVAEAVSRMRNFTCTRALYRRIPPRRTADMVDTARRSKR